jgi:pantoate--beta-alanine ligase
VKVFDDLGEWRRERDEHARAGRSLGFVPTMGALHGGHLSLVHRSRSENDRTLVSIFVNPTQFNDPSDLAKYPRDLDRDLALLRAEGVDAILLPTESQLYPDGYTYRIVEREQADLLEGAFRPGHFEGVLTVVMKLLQIAAANRAYFGEKDWQQVSLIQGMADAFFLPTAIIACPTVREPSGLAMSSRNARLSKADAEKAATFYGVLSTTPTAAAARDRLQKAGFVVDYVEDHNGRRLAAVRLGGVRLIDNVPVDRHP